jgi:hypothetical protein
MPSLHPPLTTITTAERSGGNQPSQDRIFLTDNAVIVLDGASHPDPTTLDGRWIADQLGEELRSRLADDPAGSRSRPPSRRARHHRHLAAPGRSRSVGHDRRRLTRSRQVRHPPTWREAYELATTDPALLVDVVHQAELSDPTGSRWPRSNCHDDKALAVIQFNTNGATG